MPFGKPSAARVAMRLGSLLILGAVWSPNVPLLRGQTMEEEVRELSDQVAELSAVIAELRAEIASSRAETRELRLELERSREPGQPPQALGPGPSVGERLTTLEENQDLLDGRLEEQYQTKLESASRYRTRLSGIVLLNAFQNRGSVDSQELPNLALPLSSAGPGEAPGLSALQSQLGFETYGPNLAGARASAGLQFDFFGVAPDSPYTASWGAVRLRTAIARLDWDRTSLVVGQDVPFMSPLSPTSIASLAFPAFSQSGNLWAWIPQARIEHRFQVSEESAFSLEGGFLGPIRQGSLQPGYATRVAWAHGETDRPLVLGLGTYYTRWDGGSGRARDGWAGSLDWRVPIGGHLEASGEFYRGRGLGSLGAAQGRSLVFDGPESDPASSMVVLNVTGGWSQLTFRPSATLELNAAYGEEQAYGDDLEYTYYAYYDAAPVSRNQTDMVNLIYRPRTDLVFSVEYRHLKTWRVDRSAATAGHVNLAFGVLF